MLALIVLPRWESISKKSLKAQNLDFYYKNSYMEYYYFFRQYENNFDIASANRWEQISFKASFLKDRILYQKQ